MSLSLPYFRNRRYLTGIDWFIGALGSVGRATAGTGAYSQAVLDLDGHLDEKPLASALDQISQRFPLIHGRPARDFLNLAPYWRTPRSSRGRSIPLRVIQFPPDAPNATSDSDRLLAEHVNTPFASESQHLRVLLLHLGPSRSRLGLMFDHRLLDAFGAEALARLIDLTWHGRLEEFAPRVQLTEPAHLDHWKRRFASGKILNELLFRVAKTDICGLSRPPAGPRRSVHFLHDSLTPQEASHFDDRATDEVGLPILLPSAAARAIAAMRHSVTPSPLPGDQYTIFTSASTRPPGQEWESMFFNRFSLLLFTAPTALPDPEIVTSLRDQFFDHMSKNMPFVMQDASALARICPTWLGGRIMRWSFHGRLCSLYFACLKDTGFPTSTFLGLPVSNLIHMPLAFSPPGLNLCMTYFAGRCNLMLSYVDGALDDETARGIMRRFKESLL